MEEGFLAQVHLLDDAWWSQFYDPTYMDMLDRQSRYQEPPHEDVEEDALALALAPYLDPHYGDRHRGRDRHHHHHRSPPISFQQPRSRPRSPSPSPDATTRSNKRACIPASDKAILGLKEVVLTTTDVGDDCAICLKALDDRPPDQEEEEDTAAPAAADAETTTTAATSALRAMPCSHIFHQHCIFQWLRRNAVCPLCRHQLPTIDDDDDDDDDDEADDERGARPMMPQSPISTRTEAAPPPSSTSAPRLLGLARRVLSRRQLRSGERVLGHRDLGRPP
ncbi:E3 ubiquitin-protein ligase RNF38-like [Sorghum bicolor]|uniref:E3 ubiquitin-protein ligase RNF38-like n=1 Tax=Sorghum bicolor TaxID=4558 RepID=UPI000B4251D2|nr:E3 ubiquitin-protein ligase RNF38-like [Sorghum bicolor]|eukprot:XP_021303867.1 E3 ubiquitin-protein ligase RNF38-like [Sorghum bicolor]